MGCNYNEKQNSKPSVFPLRPLCSGAFFLAKEFNSPFLKLPSVEEAVYIIRMAWHWPTSPSFLIANIKRSDVSYDTVRADEMRLAIALLVALCTLPNL